MSRCRLSVRVPSQCLGGDEVHLEHARLDFPIFLLFPCLVFTFFFLSLGLKGEQCLCDKNVLWGNYDHKIKYLKVIYGVSSYIDVYSLF